MFELRIIDPVPGLELLGTEVQLRELPFGEYSAVFDASHATGRGMNYIVAASLFVDGAPLGIDGLDALPGRYHSAIVNTWVTVAEMYNLRLTREPAAASNDATDPDEAPAVGEA